MGFHQNNLMMDASDPNRKKMAQKTVVIVRAEAKLGKHGGEAPPDDWSWRKYGQKPIKDSPYPRAYYRCSSSKGCSAKKQVERCKKDESLIIITYTSSHNHPGPVPSTLNKSINSSRIPILNEDCRSSEKNRNVEDNYESSIVKCAQESTEKVQGEVVLCRKNTKRAQNSIIKRINAATPPRTSSECDNMVAHTSLFDSTPASKWSA